ncbi:MAG: 16S rRNA (uracil(1498)-N(3))-methyltransferase [Dysgonamonadaceae bacterium]|jgi:16S rRNA (uracil1498-N3)-methyltransferase|nr:16S rRNA (uracil(1498)-N(3))-methyltransferase [Dysgonamonadaceae bacterium]
MTFYAPNICGDRCTLDKDESAHAVKVLRLKAGDSITLADGKGGMYSAVIVHSHSALCEVAVTGKRQESETSLYRLHMGIAPTKNIDRFEWFVEKSTEIGIDEITPLLCEHSERKNIPMERIRRIVIAAMKQSGKAYLPKVNPVSPLTEWLNVCESDQKLIAWCGDSEKKDIRTSCMPGKSVAVAIGPEGDFSLNEIQQASAAGFECITLGKSRLRTETAGIVACHSIYLINN